MALFLVLPKLIHYGNIYLVTQLKLLKRDKKLAQQPLKMVVPTINVILLKKNHYVISLELD